MSKKCNIKVGGKPCGKVMALKDYADHLKQFHQIQLTVNPIETYLSIREQVEYVYDISNAALNKDGVLVDMVARGFYGFTIYDATTGKIEVDSYDTFIDYLVPFISTITRAGRDLREEDKKNRQANAKNPSIPLLHPHWKYSEHVKVYRGSKFLSYKSFFSNRKKIESL